MHIYSLGFTFHVGINLFKKQITCQTSVSVSVATNVGVSVIDKLKTCKCKCKAM